MSNEDFSARRMSEIAREVLKEPQKMIEAAARRGQHSVVLVNSPALPSDFSETLESLGFRVTYSGERNEFLVLWPVRYEV